MSGNRIVANKVDVLLAVALSEVHKCNIVDFIPIGMQYTRMLNYLRAKELVRGIYTERYCITDKGIDFLKRQNIDEVVVGRYCVVNQFIDNL